MARKILLADDSVTAQNMGRKILADAGYEVITVNNGSAALKKIAEIKPDLIVLDVYMPGYSGLEVCQRVKEAGETARIPILLTVGKLEPFKPEEAKRVRAEGFIVKPFEASELLSAMTKLEDKMVPRSESSKPGRFARAIAAVEEGRYDKSAAMDEDTGWKNRISFPSKRKRAPVEAEDGDDPAIYNAVNKDLRTVVDRHPSPVAHHATATEAKVDLGALAPEGLPKDVTPEEIAALAAAAAQIQGKTVETKVAETKIEETNAEAKAVDAQPTETHAVEPSLAESLPEQSAVHSHEVGLDTSTLEATTATDAPEQPAETAQQVASLAAPSSADVTAAISSLETAGISMVSRDSPNEFSSHSSVPQLEAEPVTMAVAAGAEHAAPSRWAAVSMTLAPEEAAIDLEDEMRKALASRAAVDTAGVAAEVTLPELPPSIAEPAATAEIPPPVEPEHQVLATVAEPELSQTSGAAESAETEPFRPAVKEFETVTASSWPDATPAELEPAPPQTIDSATPPSLEAPPPVEAETPENPATAMAEMESPTAEAIAERTQLEESKPEEPTPASSEPTAEQKSEEPTIPAPVVSAAPQDLPAIDERPENAELVAVSQVSEEHPAGYVPTPELAESADTTHGGIPEMAKKESDIAATTAAAWASWRRIRETRDPKDAAQSKNKAEEKAASPSDEAAMAVAAGAEKAPEEVPAGAESPEIASIVDSVLADLRPRIVEEITRKMGKKK